ncbi:MAG: rhomboid family intramembrane serine protease [Ferruginibacter sp.]
MNISITLLIIIATCIVSFVSFSNQELMNKLIFYPPAVSERKQWYRFFSCGLIHADIGHLMFNMFALYIFGEGQKNPFTGKMTGLEYDFIDIFGDKGRLVYLLMYISALAVCLVPTYQKQRDNYYYKSLGASGAVSAVVFAAILLKPDGHMGLLFIPVYLVSFLFGAIYLAVTYYLDKRGDGNINHSAHLWGALYGIVFLFSACRLAGYPVLSIFLEKVTNLGAGDIIQFGR